MKKIHSWRIPVVKKLLWIDVVGLGLFCLILVAAALFLLRKSSYVVIELRLFEREGPDFYFNRPRQTLVEQIKPGLKEKDIVGNLVTEIVDVDRPISSTLHQDVFVTLKVKSVFNARTGQYSYNGSPLLIGSYKTFNFDQLQLNGVITDVGNSLLSREKKTFRVTAFMDPAENELISSEDVGRIDGLSFYLANSIKEGMEIVNVHGQPQVVIDQVIRKPARRIIVNSQGVIQASDPQKVRIELVLLVTTEKINDSYYYQKDAPLLIGQPLLLYFDTVSLKPTILSIEEVD